MTGKYFLFGYLLIKLMALVCKADGEPGQPGGFIMIATSNGSREDEMVTPDTPHTEDECMGYYDVMGQWDPPFTCSTGDYLYCCGTCGFRYCCTYRRSRLDQSTCKNNRTMEWMKTMNTPKKKKDPLHDPTKDKTNMVVYVICGVVAIMALVGIFTKLGLEKAHRPQRENMSRAVASVLQGGLPGGQFQGEDALGMHTQHYDARANNQGGQINNNVAPGSTLGGVHPYPALAQLAQVYEQKQQGKELSKYASLKAVAAKANGDYYSKRRLMVELPSKGLPLQPLQTMRTMNRTMSSNMTSNMGSNMASNMGSNMGSNMASNMGSNMASNMGSNMASNMSSNMGSNMGSNMNSAMTSLGPLSPEPVATYVTEMPSATIISSTLPSMHSSSSTPKPNGQKPKGGGHGGHSRGPVFLGMTGPGNMSGGTMSGTMSSAMSNAMSGTMSGAMSSAMSNAMSGTMSGAMSSAMSNAMSGTMSGAMSSTLSGAMTGRMADGSAPGSHHHRVSYSSNTLGGPGHGHSQGMVMGLKGWDGTETVGRRKAYGPRRGGPCTVEQVNELGPSRNHSHSQHFLPTQPYFVTNSKTEVTV